MQKFKQIIFLYLSVTVFTISCIETNLTSSTQSPISSAMFIVDEIKGDLNISKQNKQDALPKTFTLKLHACIRARLRNQPLPFTDYAITHKIENFNEYKKSGKSFIEIKASSNLKTKTGKEIIRIKTDGRGCLNWTEEFDYAYYNQSQWIVIDRYIQGLSNGWPGITGKIPIAINPWLQLDRYKSLQVVDYREKYGHKEHSTLKNNVFLNGQVFLQKQKEKEKQNKVNIIIDKLNFYMDNQISKEGKRIIKAHISAKVNYTIRDIFGGQKDNQINTGEFTIQPMLFVEAIKALPKEQTKDNIIKQYLIMNETDNNLTVQTEFKNNYLTSETFTWTIPSISQILNVSLYIKVIPKGSTEERINPFEGIYSFGTIDEIINTPELKLNSYLAKRHYKKVDRSNFNIKNNTNKTKIDNFKQTAKSITTIECLKKLSQEKNLNIDVINCISQTKPNDTMDSFNPSGWVIDPLKINYIALQKENWLSRTVSTTIKTIIRDPFLKKTIDSHSIKIKITDLTTGEEENIEKVTENNGEVSFNTSTIQYWYKKQRYFLKIIHFTTDSKELDVKKIIAINPWDYGWTHGFEVNQVEDIRTTCLKSKDNFTQVINLLSARPKKMTKINANHIPLIKELFCYIANPQTAKQEQEQEQIKKWNNVFQVFRNVFHRIYNKIFALNDSNKKSNEQTNDKNNLEIQLENAFKKKFVSVEDIPAGRSYIHLFRSINKYPTLLIDSSLNRSVFYNLRIKLTPRVVRMDSLNKGQQDKGPLRDGVYVLQMALLKNEQERENGMTSGAMKQTEYSLVQSGDHNISHTTALHNCPSQNNSSDSQLHSSNCITKKDFLIPPFNIPVITRDGVIRTDIHLPIARANLIFANSKNTLVFRILPADPNLIKCTNNTSGVKCANNKNFDMGYDWKNSLPIIRPVDKKYYDMIFYTYKTPFIPSEWNNWNIAREMGTTFSDLEKLYDELTAQANTLKNQIDNREKQKDQLPDEEENTNLYNPKSPMASSMTLASDKNFTTENLQTLKGIHEEFNQKNKDDKIVETNIFDVSQENHTESDKMNNPHNETICPHVSIAGENYPVLPKDSDKCACLSSLDSEQPIPESARCAQQREEQNTDLSNQHIAHFAASNALCMIPINSSSNAKHCGNFDSPKKIEQDFMQSLNKQIQIINTIVKDIHSPYKNMFSLSADISGNLPSANEIPTNELEKTLIYNQTSSKDFKNKLSSLPELPQHLTTKHLENIIHSGINKDTLDLNQIAFMHALCGFWFEKFYTKEYTHTELLADALKKTVRKTFYYKLQGINPLPDDNTLKEDNISNKNINLAMEELKKKYTNHLNTMQLNGYIDDVHNWVNGHAEYGFDSNFYQQLNQRLQKMSEKSHISHIPSWSENKNDKTFHLSYYLKEAQIMQSMGNGFSEPLFTDKHPVRKCINNPSHFFGFEKKIISGQIGSGILYEKGDLFKLNVTKDFMINTQRDQGANQDASTSLGSNLNLIALPLMFFGSALVSWNPILRFIPFLTKIKPKGLTNFIGKHPYSSIVTASGLTTILAAPSASWNYRSYEGTGKRKMLSYRVSQGVELIVDHAKVKIPLKKYHECLVVRPRFSAFEPYNDKYEHIWTNTNKVVRSMYQSIGMLLCTEGKNHSITEDYYFIYPNYPINSLTIDTKNYRNKPFTISLRGQNEYNKFISDLSCWITNDNETSLKNNAHCRDTNIPFHYLFTKKIEIAQQLRAGFEAPKLFHHTQISPGVYSPTPPIEDKDIRADSTDSIYPNGIINWMTEWSLMDADIEKFIRGKPPDND